MRISGLPADTSNGFTVFPARSRATAAFDPVGDDSLSSLGLAGPAQACSKTPAHTTMASPVNRLNTSWSPKNPCALSKSVRPLLDDFADENRVRLQSDTGQSLRRASLRRRQQRLCLLRAKSLRREVEAHLLLVLRHVQHYQDSLSFV